MRVYKALARKALLPELLDRHVLLAVLLHHLLMKKSVITV